MTGDFISKKTRNEFREFLTGWALREIEMVFEEAGVAFDQDFTPQTSGARRSFVEQHYHVLDFENPKDMHKLLIAFENVLNTANENLQRPNQYDPEGARRAIDVLVKRLRQDGFTYQDEKISPTTPKSREVFNESKSGKTITEVTRRNIFDYFRWGTIDWSGRLSEAEFLSRLYDLESLPSNDHRFKSAQEDIWKHCVNNPMDWPQDWVFWDSRFDLLNGSDEAFLRFLCEMVHPVVRPVSQEVSGLVKMLNELLNPDGWEIVLRTQTPGKIDFFRPTVNCRGQPGAGGSAIGSFGTKCRVCHATVDKNGSFRDVGPRVGHWHSKGICRNCMQNDPKGAR